MNRPCPPEEREGKRVFAFLALIIHRPLRDESSVSGKKWERKVKSLAAGVLPAARLLILKYYILIFFPSYQHYRKSCGRDCKEGNPEA